MLFAYVNQQHGIMFSRRYQAKGVVIDVVNLDYLAKTKINARAINGVLPRYR